MVTKKEWEKLVEKVNKLEDKLEEVYDWYDMYQYEFVNEQEVKDIIDDKLMGEYTTFEDVQETVEEEIDNAEYVTFEILLAYLYDLKQDLTAKKLSRFRKWLQRKICKE